MALIYSIRVIATGVRRVRQTDVDACQAAHQSPDIGHPLHGGHLHTRRSALLRYLLLSITPPIAATALSLVTRGPNQTELYLAVLLALVNAGMFGAARTAWKLALRDSATIDDLLSEASWLGLSRSAHNSHLARDWVVQPLHTAVAHRFQLILPLALSFIPPIVIEARHDWTQDGGYALALSWSLFFLGNVSYWLVIPPLVVVRMQLVQGLRLRWNDPARTPGIRTFSQGYTSSALLLSLAAVAVSLPSLLRVDIFGRILPYLYWWIVAIALVVGVAPQVCLFRIVRRFRHHVLDQLAAGSDWILNSGSSVDIGDRLDQRPKLREELDSYNDVAAAPSLPFGTPAGVQYAVTLVGSLLAFVLQK